MTAALSSIAKHDWPGVGSVAQGWSGGRDAGLEPRHLFAVSRSSGFPFLIAFRASCCFLCFSFCGPGVFQVMFAFWLCFPSQFHVKLLFQTIRNDFQTYVTHLQIFETRFSYNVSVPCKPIVNSYNVIEDSFAHTKYTHRYTVTYAYELP